MTTETRPLFRDGQWDEDAWGQAFYEAEATAFMNPNARPWSEARDDDYGDHCRRIARMLAARIAREDAWRIGVDVLGRVEVGDGPNDIQALTRLARLVLTAAEVVKAYEAVAGYCPDLRPEVDALRVALLELDRKDER